MRDTDALRTDGGTGTTLDRESLRNGEEVSDGGAGSEAKKADGPASPDSIADASEFVGEDLVISYRSTEEPVVDGESIRVPPGEVTALVGPNGSGKSTLLKGLANQLALDRGIVRLDGEEIHALGTKELARRLGLLSQENVAPESITVADLIGHGRYPHRGFFDSMTEEDRAAIDRAISLAGIDHLRDREVGSLSGGQKQLVWIAMVLAQDTDVLLLDEPTTFLDLHHQLEVMGIVETLRGESETTVVLVLHDVEQAARYADHVIALHEGEIYARGTPEEVLTEEALAEVFGVKATIEQGPWGLRVSPHRALHPNDE
jgi:iron complex transport system ATP-binding protein